MRGGGDQIATLVAGARQVNGARVVAAEVRVADAKELQALADALREKLGSGVGVLGASIGDKTTMLVVVTDDLREKGVRADALVRDIAAVAGGRGGGKPHLAQAGIPDATRLPAAIEHAPQIIERALATA
jgi:alanyl-tRNA synthetase